MNDSFAVIAGARECIGFHKQFNNASMGMEVAWSFLSVIISAHRAGAFVAIA